MKIVPLLTAMQLKRNFIKYNQIKLVENEDEKIEFIKKIHAQFVFDDQLSVLQRLPEYAQAVCVRTLHNAGRVPEDKIITISSLADRRVPDIVLKGYNLAKHKKRRCGKSCRQKCTEIFYVWNRWFWKNLVKKIFNPLIYGMENIPADKRAVIYAGNHRNKRDPVIVTLCLKRPVHWCALLRLFESKENLFGRDDIWILRKLTALLAKAMGALPIARPTDQNYRKINISSLLKADEYIKSGSAIGFFPEGTINRSPEKEDLLPVASDAVFQLAARNSCWIQLFSIVWNTDNVNNANKVVIVFADAIETTGMSVGEIKSHWEQAVRDGIKGAGQNPEESFPMKSHA